MVQSFQKVFTSMLRLRDVTIKLKMIFPAKTTALG